jgi:starch-binding outer membrane protein, SusD/RagB family
MRNVRRNRLAGAVSLLLAGSLVLTACEDLLDVDNPNSVLQEDLEAARSVNAVVNGTLSRTASAVSAAVLASVTLTDEYDWIGSWNAAGELERGLIRNPSNDFTNIPFNELAQARWLSENAIRLAEEFRTELPAATRSDIARAYFLSGIVYLTIGEVYEDFVFSDRTEAAPPIGPANMAVAFDSAIAKFTRARTEAQAVGNATIAREALAFRSRAHFAKALRQRVQPGSVPTDPWINSAEAVADANAFFQEGGTDDWRYTFTFSANTVTSRVAQWANQRNEVVVGHVYGSRDASGLRLAAITLQDPIAGVPDPALVATTTEFIAGLQYSPLRVLTGAELRLILAEAAVAGGNDGAAVQHINAVRDLKGVPAYDPAAHTISTRALLRHERMANLFLMNGRRMWDMYRFGIQAAEWTPGSDALVRPGTLFSIGQEEMLSNCYILGTC